MQDLVKKVRQFHEKFMLNTSSFSETEFCDFRNSKVVHMREEVDEYVNADGNDAKGRHDRVDALIDLIYVAAGALLAEGIHDTFAQLIFDRVHAANMRKERAAPDGSNSKRGTGFDIIKPEGFKSPEFHDLIASQTMLNDIECPEGIVAATFEIVIQQGSGVK